MSRRYLIIGSIAAHGALAAGLFISGIWKLERLESHHRRASLTIGAMMPPGEAGGGEGEQKQEAKPEKKQKKDKREKTRVELRQVEKPDTQDDVEVALATTGGGGGEGEGEGPGVGPDTGGGGGGTCDPLLEPGKCQAPEAHTQKCGDGIREAPEQCDDGNLIDGDKCSSTCRVEQVLIPPGIFTGLRISGETQIVPPDTVKTEMLRDGRPRTTGSFKLCIDASGRVSSLAPIAGGTKYPAYDAKIGAAMRAWRYKPYTINNQGSITAVPACSVVTFVYTIK